MPLFPSDFKKFKHVSNDAKTVTLQHPAGHQIIIARDAVKGDLRKQLDALCQGGEAKPKAMAEGGVMAAIRRSPLAGSGANATQAARDAEDDSRQAANGSKQSTDSTTDVRTSEQKAKAAELSKKLGYADGGEVKEASVEQIDPGTQRARDIYNNLITSQKDSPAAYDPLHPVTPLDSTSNMKEDPSASKFGPKGEAPGNFDSNAWQQARKMQATEQSANAAQTAAQQQDVIAENQRRVDAGLPPLPVPNVAQGPQMPGMTQAEPQVSTNGMRLSEQAPAAPQEASNLDPMAQMQQGYNQKLAGINQEAQARGALGEEQQKALAQGQERMAQAQANYQKHYDELDMERQNLVKDIQNGHIDPNKFWDSHSKIASGIGMILAGFNPTNSPNAAVNFLKYQMEQNLDAQKANLANKQSLLSANMRQFGNLKDAMDMTRIMQSDILQNQLQQAAAKASSPLAKSAALQAAGQLKMESAPLFQQFAMRRAFMQSMNQTSSDPSDTSNAEHMIALARLTNPEMAKEMESRLVPGVGMAKLPIPEKVRDKLEGYNQLNVAANDLLKFVKGHNTFVPGTPEYNTGQQKVLALQSLIREGKLGTVYREGEQPLLDKFVSSNPAGAMKQLKTIPQLKELLNANLRESNVTRKQYGLPLAQPEVDSRAKLEAWIKANPNHPKAEAARKALGIK
jgi:hypothetical protein